MCYLSVCERLTGSESDVPNFRRTFCDKTGIRDISFVIQYVIYLQGLKKIDMVVFFQQTTNGLELRMVGGANELEQQRLGGGEGHVHRALQSLQCDFAVVRPKYTKSSSYEVKLYFYYLTIRGECYL